MGLSEFEYWGAVFTEQKKQQMFCLMAEKAKGAVNDAQFRLRKEFIEEGYKKLLKGRNGG
jgi:hypothetical protein